MSDGENACKTAMEDIINTIRCGNLLYLREACIRLVEYVKNPKFGYLSVRHKGNCTICIDPLESEPLSMPPCGHIFHSKCIKEWTAKLNNSCPLCRSNCIPLQDPPPAAAFEQGLRGGLKRKADEYIQARSEKKPRTNNSPENSFNAVSGWFNEEERFCTTCTRKRLPTRRKDT